MLTTIGVKKDGTRDIVRHLNKFRIIADQMSVSFLTYVDDTLVAWRFIQRNCLIFTNLLKMFSQIFVSTLNRSTFFH